MKPRKKIEGANWNNPKFSKSLIDPIERFWYECEQKGLVADKEIEDWFYEIINHAYRVGYVDHSNALFESLKKNTAAIYSAMSKDTEAELNKIHERYNTPQ